MHAAAVREAQAVEFCARWFPALVRGDRETRPAVADLVYGFYTPDAVMIDPNFSEPQIGRTALIRYYQAVLGQYPRWSFEIEEIFVTERGFVLHYLGHVPGVVESFRGVDILEFDPVSLERPVAEWKISKLVGVYDRTPFRVRGENAAD